MSRPHLDGPEQQRVMTSSYDDYAKTKGLLSVSCQLRVNANHDATLQTWSWNVHHRGFQSTELVERSLLPLHNIFINLAHRCRNFGRD